MKSRLGSLQYRTLEVLAGMGWVLTGGAALAGFHLGHRETRDLDLFWRDRSLLERLPNDVEGRLVDAGLSVSRLQTAPTFCRLRVTDGTEVLPLDLVIDSAPVIESPEEVSPGILVDTAYEILVNKLTTLLSRWAVRDLVDVQALEAAGLDLDRALADAPKKDGGFSPPTLAWVLDTQPTSQLDPGLLAYREELIRRLLDEPSATGDGPDDV